MITDRLKSSTKSLHTQTEKSLNSKRIFQPDFTRQEYAQILQVLFLAHSVIESQMAQEKDEQFNLLQQKHYLPRLALLSEDLKNLQAPLPLEEKGGLNFQLDNAFQAFGALYVLKGSTLGGKFIHQQLQKNDAEWSKGALRFYGFEKEKVMENWQDYLSDFNALEFSGEEQEEVILGAQKTFKVFIDANLILDHPST